MQAFKTIVVTGSNRGIGLGIVEDLLKKPYNVIMACRSLEKGNESKAKLLASNPQAQGNVSVMELDVGSSESISNFLQEFSKTKGKADILVNNAGIAGKLEAFDAEVVETTFKVNLYGTIELSERFIPFLNENGKIVTLGSSSGHLTRATTEELKGRFLSPSLTKEQLFKMASEFYERVADGTYLEHGWTKNAYGTSKLFINTYCRLLAQNPDIISKKIQAYVCCPGWVKTDMGGPNANRTLSEGIVTPMFLIELPFVVNPSLQGKFFYDKEVKSL